MIKRLGTLLAGPVLLVGCSPETMEAISAGMAQAAYETSYSSAYNSYGYNGYGGYGGYGTYTPYGFSSSRWPVQSGYGSWVGPYGCRTTGTFYACDSGGDGYIDMWGNTDDGSYSSQYSRVNGRGEGFSWDSDCDCWQRDRSLDGPYRGPDREGKYRRRRGERDYD